MQQIADWLEKLNLGQCAQRFAENDIDVSVLRHLTDADLEKIGVSLGHRRPIRSPTTTRPVAMPTRVCSVAWIFRSLTAATNFSPARTARSASSSCAWG